MSKLFLATVAAAALGMSLFSTANAGGSGYSTYRDRLGFGNYTNSTQLTGVAPGNPLAVLALILPSGEAVDLR